MKVMKYRLESFEWARIPEDLNRKNLALIVAKTTATTVHPKDVEYPIRIFKESELEAAARSLARREVGLNHRWVIDNAFTVDANWNPVTKCVEALIYLPDEYIEKVRNGFITEVSVEYNWRDEKRTEAGVEFEGLCLYRVDLLENMGPGDHNTMITLVESESTHRASMEGSILLPCVEKVCKHCSECGLSDSIKDDMEIVGFDQKLDESADMAFKNLGEPFAQFKDWDACIAYAKRKKKSNPDAYCGYVKSQTEDKKKEGKESQVTEKPVNVMAGDSVMKAITGEPKPVNKPDGTITSVGVIEGGDKTTEEDKTKKLVESADPGAKPVDKPVDKPVEGAKPADKPTDKPIEKPTDTSVGNKPLGTPVELPELKALKESLAAKDALIVSKDALIKQQQEAVDNMQKKILEHEAAAKHAKAEGRKEILTKVESVLPNGSKVSGWSKGGQILATEIRKILYESEEKKE
jgi:hypothetical protein